MRRLVSVATLTRRPDTQAFTSAPGGVFGGHHSYPGGLAIHEAFNLSSALSLATNYRRTYGHRGASGLPEVGLVDNSEAANDIAIDQNMMIASPIWHDWAKTIVFQWTETGDEFPEFNFGGNGKTDKFGAISSASPRRSSAGCRRNSSSPKHRPTRRRPRATNSWSSTGFAQLRSSHRSTR
jgi:hypothetical protein